MTTLELGAGKRPTPGVDVYHDRVQHSAHIQVAHDLNLLPWPFLDEAYDKVVALDVIEHLKLDKHIILNELWRITKPDGQVMLRVPYYANPVSWRDPTHVHIFHEETFYYWDKRHALHKDYGSIYYGEYNQWWRVESVDFVNPGKEGVGDIGVLLIKEV
jgi:SAM-dependent methyltransferase